MSGTFTPGPSTTGTSVVIAGLTPGTSYDFEVTATNAAGTSPPSSVLSGIRPLSGGILPSAPQNLVATGETPTSVSLAWTDPSTGGAPAKTPVGWASTTFTQLSPDTLTVVLNQSTVPDQFATTYPFYGNTPLVANYYWEDVVVAPSSVSGVQIGLGPVGGSATDGVPLFLWGQGGLLSSNGGFGNLGSWAPYVSGSTLCFAFDFVNGMIYGRVGATGFWNNSPTANPTTNTGGLPIPAPLSLLTGVVPSGTLYEFNSSITGHFTTSKFIGTPPAGFIPIDPVGTGVSSFNYTVEYRPTGTTAFTDLPTTTLELETVSGLAMGTSYDFQVFAANTVGRGIASSLLVHSTTVTTVTAPNTPTSLAIGALGTNSATLTWVASSVGSAPINYQTQWSLAGQNVWNNGPSVTVTTAQVTGLSPSTSYDFRVQASNGGGTSGFLMITSITTIASIPTVTWSSAGASPAISLSADKLTVTAGGSSTPYSTPQTVVSSKSLSVGRAAVQFTLVSAPTQNTSLGLVNSAFTFGTTGGNGATANGVGYYMATGVNSQAAQSVYYNNTLVLAPTGGVAADTVGAVITILVDRDAGVWWIQSPAMVAVFGAGAYNNAASVASGGTMDPANGRGGVPIGVVGDLLLCMDSGEGGSVVRVNAGSSPFIGGAVPSGFPPWSGGAAVIVAPGTVNGVATSSTLSTSIGLTWPVPAGTLPMNYIVQFRVTGTTTFATFGTATSPSINVTGLAATTSYDFRVQASNPAGTGGFSTVLAASTTAVQAAPGQVVGVSVGSPTTTSLVATWQPPVSGGTPTSYTVQYKLSTVSTYTSATATTGTSLILSGLVSASTYNVHVFATNNTGSGPVSSPDASGTTQTAVATGNFSVRNGSIIDPNGNVFVARGINLDDGDGTVAVINNAGQPLTTIFPGINFIRLGVYPTSGLGTTAWLYKDPSFYLGFVTELTKAGIVVELDDHSSNGGFWENWIPGGIGGQVSAPPTGAVLQVYLNFWTSMARQFANNPLVWIESLNELNSADNTYALSSIQAISTYQLALYNALRGAGFNNIITLQCGVGGGNPGTVGLGSGLQASVYASMRNVVWTLHSYYTNGNPAGAAAQVAGQATGPVAGGGGGAGYLGAQTITSLDGVMPVIFDEFGSADGNAQSTNGTSIISALQALLPQNIGFAAWAWYPSAQWQMVINGNIPGGPFSLTTWGQEMAALITFAANLSPPSQTTRVVAPLTVPVTTGSWVNDQKLPVAAMLTGFMEYTYLLPQGYSDPANAHVIYPMVFLEHQNSQGGSPYPRDTAGLANQAPFGGAVNTVAWRTAHPAIVVMPLCNQDLDTSGSNGNANFGGYADAPNSGGNEQGVNALYSFMVANFRVDVTKVYSVGQSLGGYGTIANMVDNHRYGTSKNIWTAGWSLSDGLNRATQPVNSTFMETLRGVPIMTCPTPSDNAPDAFDHPMWDYLSGGRARPQKAQYDSGGAAAIRASTTCQYYMVDNPSGGVPWDSSGGDFIHMNADGGDGTALWALLFSFTH